VAAQTHWLWDATRAEETKVGVEREKKEKEEGRRKRREKRERREK